MRSILWGVVTLSILAVVAPSLTSAQADPASGTEQAGKATLDPSRASDKGDVSAHAPAGKQDSKPTLEQEIEALKNRIDELESEVNTGAR